MATWAWILGVRVWGMLQVFVDASAACCMLKLWLARVELGKYFENRYSRESSLCEYVKNRYSRKSKFGKCYMNLLDFRFLFATPLWTQSQSTMKHLQSFPLEQRLGLQDQSVKLLEIIMIKLPLNLIRYGISWNKH